jgi:signal transduction histidine kinase
VSGPGLLLLARPDGKPLPRADRALVEQLAAGVGGVLAHEQMVADLAHARDLLARADRLAALGTLAAGVAHEIRNPLVSVQTFIQLLPERLHDEEFRTGFRNLALGEIDRICGLINDLLSFARPAPAHREPTDVNELVEQIVRLLDAEARKQAVIVQLRADATLPLVVVDDAQVKQVLLNVILNAIQACTTQTTVAVTTAAEADADGRWCVVRVVDGGPGIAAEHRHQAFEAFFTTKEAGSGLGLFIARQIMTAHHGRITIGPRDGGGTLCTLHFPIAESDGASS